MRTWQRKSGNVAIARAEIMMLADEEMARAMEHRAALLLGRLGLDKPHVCPGDRLADGSGVSGIVLPLLVLLD